MPRMRVCAHRASQLRRGQQRVQHAVPAAPGGRAARARAAVGCSRRRRLCGRDHEGNITRSVPFPLWLNSCTLVHPCACQLSAATAHAYEGSPLWACSACEPFFSLHFFTAKEAMEPACESRRS